MLDVKDLAPGIVIEMRYASTDNFTGKKLYRTERCLLCEPAATRLARVQKNLEKKGLGLKVWDCYRPLSIQKKLWKIVPDPRYVADPRKGSRHNRGASVDLTLVDHQGRELPMPTAYDDFSPKAHRNYSDLPKEIIRNRKTLEDAMQAEGFIGLATEWWHFDDPEWSHFALRNEPLSSTKLSKEKRTKSVPIPPTAKQLVIVKTNSWNASTGTLQRYERTGPTWTRIGRSWPISIGSKGMAWGLGTHAARSKPAPKKEGDKKTPAGVFKIGPAYGYAPHAPAGTSWSYTQVNGQWRCVDDSASLSYNKIVKADSKLKKDWSSAEKMKRSDHLYKWVINIEQNYPHVSPGQGSCIFFHVWRQKNKATRGCTAMSEKQMQELLTWLDPQENPHVVQLPQSIYTSVKNKWKLP